MHSATEISKPLVAALRISEALPNLENASEGTMRILYGEHYRPVGYLVEKNSIEDAWENPEPRYFITESHSEAMQLLSVPFAELPAREAATG